MSSHARCFALKTLLFFSPILLFVGVAEWALWRTGETVPAAQIAVIQEKAPRMVWLRALFGQSFAAYKWENFQRRRPAITTLGSSRVMKFRSEMFSNEPGMFYNCGGMILSSRDLKAFANILPDKGSASAHLRIAIVGVDFWWLNPERIVPGTKFSYGHQASYEQDNVYDWRAHIAVMREIAQLRHKKKKQSRRSMLLDALFHPPYPENLGIMARLTNEGFRFDGSKSSQRALPLSNSDWERYWNPENDEWYERISKGQDQGKFTAGVSRERLKELQQALEALQRKGVLVIVFNPPLVSHDAKLMETIPEQQRLWREYQYLMAELCKKLGIAFCDASTPQKLGLNDKYMADAVHAEETFHLHILRQWLKNPVVKTALPNTAEVVETVLASPKTNSWYPDYSSVTTSHPSNKTIH